MGFLIIFDHNRLGMCFCGLCRVGEAFFYGNKRVHVWHRERKKRQGKVRERESHPEIGGAFWQTVGIHFTPR